MVLGLLMGCSSTETIKSDNYKDFMREGEKLGYIYFAKAQHPLWVTPEGLGEVDDIIGTQNSQEEANRLALQKCGTDCKITMEGSKITPEGERLIKEAKLREQEKIKGKQIKVTSMIDDAKDKCKVIGFEEGTEKFSDCTLKLYSQSVELAAKQNQQVVIQGQSSGSSSMTIYDPVRDNNALIKRGQGLISGTCTLADLSTC